MLTETPKLFTKLFLLKFTEELIRNSNKGIFIELEKQTKEKKEAEKKLKKIALQIKPHIQPQRLPRMIPSRTNISPTKKRVLKIPSTKLPERLRYLKPTPTKIQIDLGKLNPLLRDPHVKSIECTGPDEKVTVKTPSTKPTNITLTKEEIDKVIQKFSQIAKIPIQDGVFKVVAGRLILSAIISEVIPTNFIIRKMV